MGLGKTLQVHTRFPPIPFPMSLSAMYYLFKDPFPPRIHQRKFQRYIYHLIISTHFLDTALYRFTRSASYCLSTLRFIVLANSTYPIDVLMLHLNNFRFVHRNVLDGFHRFELYGFTDSNLSGNA